jgi:hypothetical protein
MGGIASRRLIGPAILLDTDYLISVETGLREIKKPGGFALRPGDQGKRPAPGTRNCERGRRIPSPRWADSERRRRMMAGEDRGKMPFENSGQARATRESLPG